MNKLFYCLSISMAFNVSVFAAYMPMEIKNNSGFADEQIYVVAKGIDLHSGKDCFLKFTATTLYEVKVLIGENTTVKYEGKPLEHLQTLTQVPVPFVVEVNGQEANIYIKYPLVRPYYDGADGIMIEATGPQTVNIIFPGRAKS